MNTLLKLGSALGLGLTVVPACLVLLGKATFAENHLMATIGMLLWFATAPFWINKKTPRPEQEA